MGAVRSALAGGASLAFAFLVGELLSVFFGDSSGIRAVGLASLAIGAAVGAGRRPGRRAWLRPAIVGGLAVACSSLLPDLISFGGAGHIPSSGAGRAIAVALIALAVGFVTGWVFSPSNRRAVTRAAWLAGGALGIVAIELVVSRRVGAQGAFFVIAFVALLPCVRWRLGRRDADEVDALEDPEANGRARLWFELGIGAVLGLFVEVTRPILRDVLGPAHENWAALTSAVALSLAAATVLGARLRVDRARILLVGALVSAGALLFATELFEHTTHAWQSDSDTGARGIVKLAFVSVLIAPAVVSLGAAAFARGSSPLVVSRLVLGMMAGVLVARHALEPIVPLAVLACAVSVAAALLSFLATRTVQRLDAGLLVALSALLAVSATRFPEQALSDGSLDAEGGSSDESTVWRAERFRRGGSALAVLRDSHGIARVRGDGHDDEIGEAGQAISSQVVVGAIHALYTTSHARAFVLDGPGGTAAGTAARLFGEVVVVAPNRAARDVMQRQSAVNFDLVRRPNVSIHTDADPFVVLASTSARFDAIVSATPALRDVAASKFATKEFLALARSRLAPGGVVALSFDDRLPLSGLAIVLRTLSDAFAECHFVFLGAEHYDVVCGDHLAPNAVAALWPPELLSAMAPLSADLGIDRFLEALILVPDQFHGEWFPAANSFDLPVLDHVMAREDSRATTWDLDLAVHFDLGGAALAGARFDGARTYERCFAFGLIGSGETLPRCQTMLRTASGRMLGQKRFPLPATFLDLSAGAASRNVRGTLSGASLLDELVYAGEGDRARALVATRSQKGTLTAIEANYARRRGLIH